MNERLTAAAGLTAMDFGAPRSYEIGVDIRQPMRRLGAAMRLRAVLRVALGLTVVSACAASQQASLPEEFLGQWYYMGSSGGIAGAGLGDEATGYIVIHADNTMRHFGDDGTLVTTTEFAVSLGPTIFSTNPQWVLNPDSPVPEVLVVSSDGQLMSIQENVYDGFARAYARSR